MTAYHALFHDLKLEPGQSLFINGGSTAVGIFAIQLAKAHGCTVTVSASTGREEFLRSLGIDNVRTLFTGFIFTVEALSLRHSVC